MTVQADILPPRYRDVELIGRGGMGEIYRARDETLGRTVAIKLLAERYAADQEVRRRFTREALAAARLSGEPAVVTIFDVGEWNGRPFIVMEHLDGGSLAEVLDERGAVPPDRALSWLEDAARAIDAAHSQGVVHRDVKPGNLLLDHNGEVHVADFGIASAAGLDSLTQTGTVLGTAGYLAPEQARGERTTPASDRYALAVLAFELLSGRRPFESESPTAEALGHVQGEIPAISDVNRGLPAELDPVFERALAKEPSARFPSCAQFVAALRDAFATAEGTTAVRPVGVAAAAATAPLTAAPAGAAPIDAAPPRRRRRAVLPLVLVGLLAIGLAGAAVAALMTGGDGEPQVRERTIERTVTRPGTTTEVEVTVTETAPADEPPPPPPPTQGGPGQGSVGEGIRLTDQATALIREGRYAEALPIAMQALAMLEGTGHTYEAYANYDVGKALAELGRCEEARPYLDRRERMLGPHPDVTAAREKCAGDGGGGGSGDGGGDD